MTTKDLEKEKKQTDNYHLGGERERFDVKTKQRRHNMIN